MILPGVKVFAARYPADLCKGPDGLLAPMRDAGSDPFSGALYDFRAKWVDRVRIVWWGARAWSCTEQEIGEGSLLLAADRPSPSSGSTTLGCPPW
jgi:hypothetical protein